MGPKLPLTTAFPEEPESSVPKGLHVKHAPRGAAIRLCLIGGQPPGQRHVLGTSELLNLHGSPGSDIFLSKMKMGFLLYSPGRKLPVSWL